jgi:transposase
MPTSCEQCEMLRAELALAREKLRDRDVEIVEFRKQLRETTKLIELQRADLERYRQAYEQAQPNRPERVPEEQLQLAFERVLASLSDAPAATSVAALGAGQRDDTTGAKGEGESKTEKKNRHEHGRRRLDLLNLPVEHVEIDPDDVVAANRRGFVRIGEEVSERVAYKPGGYVRLRIVRPKYVRAEELTEVQPILDARTGEVVETNAREASPVLVAELPQSVWPNTMADPSAIAQVIISKYDDYLPLHRQERISARQGFVVPRSTQCGWLGAAYTFCYRIVDAMFAEARAHAFCIATDATGARVRGETAGPCDSWTVFVFIADLEHVIFRYARENTSATMQAMLGNFRGRLLADASKVYDALHRLGVTELACWFHARRYFWRGIATDPDRATEALALISLLFKVERESRKLPMPERTASRAEQAQPILELFDAWVAKNRGSVDPRGPLDKAIGYYDNQRDALRRFLEDGRLRLDNNLCEQQLRNTKLGLNNWTFFENETGLRWYTTFRSLIASARLHGLNAHEYVEQLLRLAPHWPVSRVLELAPKYWTKTIQQLDVRHSEILKPPWLRATSPTAAAAA